MSDSELLALVNEAERDAVRYSAEFMNENENLLKRYNGEPYGDEVEGQSQVVTSDVQDTVESDMPSLVRIFLGSKDIMTFDPATNSDADKLEAEQKTKYVNWLIRNQATSFKVIHDWIKDAEIQKLGVVKFGYEEVERTEIDEWDGINEEELEIIDIQLKVQSEKGVKVEYIEQADNDDDTKYIKVRQTFIDKRFFVRGVPTEDFIISRNAADEDDAEIIGDTSLVTRGELVAAGYDEAIVKQLPSVNDQDEVSTMKAIRFRDQGGDKDSEDISHWASQLIQVFYLYVKVDYDNDGIAERRYIVKAGNVILENEQHGMVPYAINSAILMPHSAIGRGRAELVTTHQRVSTVLTRNILNNIYNVANGRVVVNDEQTNIDDLLTVRPNGIVRTEGDPTSAVFQLQTPYIGDQALQVIQYWDSLKSQSTGNQLANQGLDADRFGEESVARFEGMSKSGAAKTELVARVMSETGFRKLFDGMAWYVSRYQVEDLEIMILGKPMTIQPLKWVSHNSITSNVGLAAGDDEAMLQNMGQLFQILQQLKATGSTVTDDKKIYNVMVKILGSMGISRIGDFANDPEIPQEVLMAENAQMKGMLQQLQGQEDPLAKAAMIEQQGKIAVAQGTLQLKAAELEEKRRQANVKELADANQTIADLEFKYSELELKFNTDIPGQGQGA
ncbi:MAG: hypothetical protein JKY52_09365 [Flavobacteriales bacterium]|nr:hypothetical protein [Flavobacteriales bacterium]